MLEEKLKHRVSKLYSLLHRNLIREEEKKAVGKSKRIAKCGESGRLSAAASTSGGSKPTGKVSFVAGKQFCGHTKEQTRKRLLTAADASGSWKKGPNEDRRCSGFCNRRRSYQAVLGD